MKSDDQISVLKTLRAPTARNNTHLGCIKLVQACPLLFTLPGHSSPVHKAPLSLTATKVAKMCVGRVGKIELLFEVLRTRRNTSQDCENSGFFSRGPASIESSDPSPCIWRGWTEFQMACIHILKTPTYLDLDRQSLRYLDIPPRFFFVVCLLL